jgi:hypothetical protein
MSENKRNILILAAIGIALIILVSVLGAKYITLAPVFTSVLYAGLVAITIMYVYFSMQVARATRQQADASMKMAEEMREQRYDSVRPIIDFKRQVINIQREEDLHIQTAEALAASSGNTSRGLSCELHNIGLGPAIDVYSFVQLPSGNRMRRDFGTVPKDTNTNAMNLSIEYPENRIALGVYYKDIYSRAFESSREVSANQDGSWTLGPLITRQVEEDELPS